MHCFVEVAAANAFSPRYKTSRKPDRYARLKSHTRPESHSRLVSAANAKDQQELLSQTSFVAIRLKTTLTQTRTGHKERGRGRRAKPAVTSAPNRDRLATVQSLCQECRCPFRRTRFRNASCLASFSTDDSTPLRFEIRRPGDEC